MIIRGRRKDSVGFRGSVRGGWDSGVVHRELMTLVLGLLLWGVVLLTTRIEGGESVSLITACGPAFNFGALGGFEFFFFLNFVVCKFVSFLRTTTNECCQ